MKAAIDLGYGSVKALIDGEKVLFPSAIVLQRKQDLFDPIKFDNEDQEDDYMNDLIDHMDVTISSNAVKTPGRFLVGAAARETASSHLRLSTSTTCPGRTKATWP